MTEVPNSSKNKEKFEDEYTKAIGEFGRWQIFIYLITALPIKMAVPGIYFGIIFMAPKTTYRCLERENNSTGELKNMTCYIDCRKYEYFSDFESTIIEQWDLICGRAWLAYFAQATCMFGTLLGSVIFGFISDRYGRRMTLFFAGILQTCMSFILPFCPDIWSFLVVRFLLGGATGGTIITTFILLMEIFGSRKRDLLSVIYMFPLCLGSTFVSIIAFYFRTWRSFTMVLAIPSLICLSYFFCLPESPKWLISVGRLEEASIVMTSAAKWNRLPTANMDAIVQNIAKKAKTNKKSERKAKLIDLIKLPSLRMKNVWSCLIWFTTGLTYFGSKQYIGQTASNVIVAFVLMSYTGTVGYFLGGYISNVFGRRVALSTFFIACGISNGFLALPDEWYYTKLIAGVVGVGCGHAILPLKYVFTSELFPTVTRNIGMGTSFTASKLGSILAPFVGGLRFTAGWIPPAVFSVVPILGVIACWCLPETRGKKLEDHLEDA